MSPALTGPHVARQLRIEINLAWLLRAHILMKRCARGLKVRFLSVTMPACRCVEGSATGSTLSEEFLAENRISVAGTIARKRPFA